MDPTAFIETGGAVALGLASIEGMKTAMRALSRRRNGGAPKVPACGMTPDQSQQLHELHAWHDQKDENGTPIWYTPRSMLKEQTRLLGEILKELRKGNGGT